MHLSMDSQPVRTAVGVCLITIACVVAAAGVVAMPLVVVGAIGLVAFVCFCSLFGTYGIALAFTVALPWLIIIDEVLPRLVVTVLSAAAAAAILVVASPRHDWFRRYGMGAALVLFFLPVIASAIVQELWGPGLIQAAKYVVFPTMIVAVVFGSNRDALERLARAALLSGSLALAVNLALGWTGVANLSYYGAGEILGLSSGHGLALLSGAVVGGGLAAIGRSMYWGVAVAIGCVSAIATGVRSILPGIAIMLLSALLQRGVRLRVVVLLAGVTVAVAASGVLTVVQERFEFGEERGEFASASSFGSGRGSIYAAALDGWRDDGPLAWILGTGLRTIPDIVAERLGEPFVGHSDFVEVGVQLGVVGLAGYLLLWLVLVRGAPSRLPLIALASLALFNGALEYTGAVVIAVMLAAATPATTAVRLREQTMPPIPALHGKPAKSGLPVQ